MSSSSPSAPVHRSIKYASPATRHLELYDTISTASINAPIQAIDIPNWCFFLPEDEYRACSPDHIAAGFTTALDGRRMAIQVVSAEKDLLVHHYVERLHRGDRLILESVSEMFTSAGRTTIEVEWDLSVIMVDHHRCTLKNRVCARANDEFLAYIAREALSFEQIRSQYLRWSTIHSAARTPLLAASIERDALRSLAFQPKRMHSQ